MDSRVKNILLPLNIIQKSCIGEMLIVANCGLKKRSLFVEI